MPLIVGDELARLIQLFEDRGVSFYHACQLKDFKAYLELGGISSRHTMEQARVSFTRFDTDAADRRTGAWSKVFGNLSDFGFGFARGQDTRAVPNPYGPILLVLDPRALSTSDDIAICLRSAGVQGFNRTAESLGTADDVERIFSHEYDPDEPYANAYLKRSEELRREFADRVQPATTQGWRTLNPEVSCTIENEVLSFDQLDHIVVDSYRKDGAKLIDQVRGLVEDHGLNTRVSLRRYRPGANRERILDDIVRASEHGPLTLDAFAGAQDLYQESREWVGRVRGINLGWQFDRYARYLYQGTLTEMGNDD